MTKYLQRSSASDSSRSNSFDRNEGSIWTRLLTAGLDITSLFESESEHTEDAFLGFRFYLSTEIDHFGKITRPLATLRTISRGVFVPCSTLLGVSLNFCRSMVRILSCKVFSAEITARPLLSWSPRGLVAILQKIRALV